MPFSFKPTQSETQPDMQGQVSTAPVFSQSGYMPAGRMLTQSTSLIDLILYIVAGACVLTFVVLIAYHQYLSAQAEVKKTELIGHENTFGALPLKEIERLSNRMKVASPIVKDRVLVTTAFHLLEESVEDTVTYTRFDMQFNDTLKTYVVGLSAVSPNYVSAIQQLDTFKRKPYSSYIGPVTTETVRLDDLGRVIFTMKIPLAIKGLLPEDLALRPIATVSADQPVSTLTATGTGNVVMIATTTLPGSSTTSRATSSKQVATSTVIGTPKK